jgi:Kef-type K+ transport system membrane component KefB
VESFGILRSLLLALPLLAKFAVVVAIIVGVPALSRRARVPAAVGLLLSGVVIGPHGLEIIGEHRPRQRSLLSTRVNPAAEHLIDRELLNVILVLMLATSILGPVLTERFAPGLLREAAAKPTG